MRQPITYWVVVEGKWVTRTGAELVEMYRNEVERNQHSTAATDTAVKEALIGQIGALYQRNVSLTKGHATLTRRVQELEAQLAEAQQQILANSSGPFAVAGGELFIKEALIHDGAVSKAQHDLQQDIAALKNRTNRIEDAIKFAFNHGKGTTSVTAEIEQAITRGADLAIEKAIKTGGLINGR